MTSEQGYVILLVIAVASALFPIMGLMLMMENRRRR